MKRKQKTKPKFEILRNPNYDPGLRTSPYEHPVIRIGTRKITCAPRKGLRPKYIGREFVIKFNDGNDFDQTLTEIKKWKKISYYDKKYFPRCLGFSRKEQYIVQERIFFKVPATVKTKELERAKKIVGRLIKKYHLGDIHLGEYKRSGFNPNWGIRTDGRPVIYDFGF